MEQPPDHLVTVGKKRPQQAAGQLGGSKETGQNRGAKRAHKQQTR